MLLTIIWAMNLCTTYFFCTLKTPKAECILSAVLGLPGQKSTKWGIWLFFLPGSWVSLCLPFLTLPKALHLLLLVCTRGEKKSGCHFYELVMVERRGKWRNHQTKGFGWWSWGLTRGRLQGSPTPRQMCLGVTSHPQQNESPNRCLTSRPGCHASHTHTSTHQPRKDMQAHGTINYYIRKSGSTRGQTKVLTFTLMWLWPEIIRERFNWT